MADQDQIRLGTPVVPPEEVARRKKLTAAFQLAFAGENGLVVLEEIGDICHFFSPGYTPEEAALQNAFKSILHHLGAWADDDDGRREIIRRLRMGA